MITPPHDEYEVTPEHLYNMELHEICHITCWLAVIKIPGGWIYDVWESREEGSIHSPVFVPFNNEFQK